MTAPRWQNERAPLLIETETLPIVVTLFSPMSKRRSARSDVWLEMRNPMGRIYAITTADGIERVHTDDVYVVNCIFDAYGSWYVTWHGITDDNEDRPEPLLVDVWKSRDPDPLVNA